MDLDRDCPPCVPRVGPLRGGPFGHALLATVAFTVCALALSVYAASAPALLVKSGSFGGGGSGAGQFSRPLGVAIDQFTGDVYVADRLHARVEKFSSVGKFIAAWGWGVADGKSQSEVCTSACGLGIAGSGAGQFSSPLTIAVDSSAGPSAGDVYVGDVVNDVVDKFDSSGHFLSSIDGSTAPQGSYVDLRGVSVDQSGNLWTLDRGTQNVDEFDNIGRFLQEWTDPFAPPAAIAADSTNGKVYVVGGDRTTYSFTLTGGNATVIDSDAGGGSDYEALAVDPSNGNLYVDHGGDVAIYEKTGAQVDSLTLDGTDSEGLAIVSRTQTLYVSDWSSNDVTLYSPPATSSTPLVEGELATNATTSGATLDAKVFPYGLDTSCRFQYVAEATFDASGYTNPNSVPCSPSDLGSSITAFQRAGAILSGLSPATVYHFRAVATNSKGTVDGADRTFETEGPPVVSGESATNVADIAATVNGEVNPSGLDTTCMFQYVDDAAFQASGYSGALSVPCSSPDVGSAFTAQSASANIGGLTPGATYHFRVVATNSAGTSDGADTSFHTPVSFLIPMRSFGSQGSGAGQFQTPVGVAVATSSGNVFVADSGNARVDEFGPGGNFIAAWGWGVADGKAQSEMCTSHCRAGVPGSGRGQFSDPTSIAVGHPPGPSAGKVYVGDAGNNVVDKFDSDGNFISALDGSTTPEGPYSLVAGVSVDQGGNLWTLDGSNDNIDEFDATGKFVRQWTDPFQGPTLAIAVDSTHNAVYLINGLGYSTQRFTLTGGGETVIDGATTGAALGLDPSTGNVYVDHGSDVAIYDHTAVPVDHLYSLGPTTGSQGLAFRPSGSGRGSRLYVSDSGNNRLTIYGPRSAGAPFISGESGVHTSKTTATLNAAIVTFGKNATCMFQYVDDATFKSSGYSRAGSVPCAPSNLGSSFAYQTASANVGGLTTSATYHFRVVSTSSAGTTTGVDQTWQQTFGLWAPFDRCPVDDAAMLATDGGRTTLAECIASNSTNGRIMIGNLTATIGNTNVQVGEALKESTRVSTSVSPTTGAIISDLVKIPSLGVTATLESAGTPSDFSSFAGIEVGIPIIAVPIKIHLESTTMQLGPRCFLGADQNPIVLHPENTDLSNATSMFFRFDPSGAGDPNGLLQTIEINGAVMGDNSFAVPGASGCGPNGDGSLDSAVDAVAGLPSPSGSNHLVLDNASNDAAIETRTDGQQFAHDWHVGFG